MPRTISVAHIPLSYSGPETHRRVPTPCASNGGQLLWLVLEGVAGRGAGPGSGSVCMRFRWSDPHFMWNLCTAGSENAFTDYVMKRHSAREFRGDAESLAVTKLRRAV